MHQLGRIVYPPEAGLEDEFNDKQLRKVIQKKLVAAMRGSKNFDLKVGHILELKNNQQNRCGVCNTELLWDYRLKDTQQFSINLLDNGKGYCIENVRLLCLDCTRKSII